jgi:hypothetical protein
VFQKATTSVQSGLRCKRASVSSEPLDGDPTVERRVRCERVISYLQISVEGLSAKF